MTPPLYETYVLTCRQKQAITPTWLPIPHRVFLSHDYPLPAEPGKRASMALVPWGHQLGHMRCFRGHQDIAAASDPALPLLVFEDDANESDRRWLQQMPAYLDLLQTYDVVSLHGRGWVKEQCDFFTHQGVKFLTPRIENGRGWCLGSLAYLIGVAAKKRLYERQYDGMPIDIALCTDFKFCCVRESSFGHDRKHGSVVENAK